MPDMPEWVSVWAWLRFIRTPSVLTSLPHQGIDPEAMSMAMYENYRFEWEKAGSPSMSVKKLVSVMTGNPAIDPDDIPF